MNIAFNNSIKRLPTKTQTVWHPCWGGFGRSNVAARQTFPFFSKVHVSWLSRWASLLAWDQRETADFQNQSNINLIEIITYGYIELSRCRIQPICRTFSLSKWVPYVLPSGRQTPVKPFRGKEQQFESTPTSRVLLKHSRLLTQPCRSIFISVNETLEKSI